MDNYKIDYLDHYSYRDILKDVVNKDCYKINNLNLTKNDVIVDIGANIGIFSMYASKLYPDTQIYAYEASPLNYSILEKNITQNNISNINIFNLAVTSTDNQIVEISQHGRNAGATSVSKLASRFNNNNKDTFKVNSISLDSIIENNNINNITYLKMDCEGSEFDILPSYTSNIPINFMGIEIHSLYTSEERTNLEKIVKNISQQQQIIKRYK